jgi:hypothetical protein
MILVGVGAPVYVVHAPTQPLPEHAAVPRAAARDVRRTILAREMVAEHSARVEFLRPDEEYTFAAVSVSENGRRTRVEAR